MKKKGIIVLIVLAVIWGLLRVLGVINFFSLPGTSMEPNYPVKSYVISTNLTEPTYNSVVCYQSQTYAVPEGYPPEAGIFIGRIIAKGNDTLQLINGLAYINGKCVDENTSLKFMYKMGNDLVSKNVSILNKLSMEEKRVIDDTMLVSIDEPLRNQFVEKEKLIKYDFKLPDVTKLPVKDLVQAEWTANNYGPIVIPANHFFIMGDNRHNSEDSRVRGFIPADKIVGTILN